MVATTRECVTLTVNDTATVTGVLVPAAIPMALEYWPGLVKIEGFTLTVKVAGVVEDTLPPVVDRTTHG